MFCFVLYYFLSWLLHKNFNELEDINLKYEFIRFSEPILEEYDGTKSVLLGIWQPVNINSNTGDLSPMDSYREYDVWKVYDEGITETWSWLSNPYFIMSIARGMVYEKSVEVSGTIEASFSAQIPDGALPTVKNAFGIKASGTKTVKETVKLSGPDAGYSSRDFYYQHGRHTHQAKIVQEHRSNWDGVLWTKTHYADVGVPAIRHYSEDVR